MQSGCKYERSEDAVYSTISSLLLVTDVEPEGFRILVETSLHNRKLRLAR